MRTLSPSEIEEVVRYADISLNSEAAVIQSLSREAVKQKTIHQVLLMVDIENSEKDYRVGDLIAFEVDYTGLLAACTSEGIETVFVTD